MPQVAKEKESDPGEQIWAIINSVLGGLTLSSGATDMLENLIVSGIDRVKFDQVDEARALEAQENYRFLAETIEKNVRGVKSIIDISDVNDALAIICPCYPIC
jgi:hypothetical protein